MPNPIRYSVRLDRGHVPGDRYESLGLFRSRADAEKAAQASGAPSWRVTAVVQTQRGPEVDELKEAAFRAVNLYTTPFDETPR